MADVEAVVSNIWREKLARVYAEDATLGPWRRPLSFKIGEGGWQDLGGGKEPLPPDPALTDITSLSYPADSQYFFGKDLNIADLTFTSPTRLEIRVFVDSSEANDDGFGNPPEFLELGIFDDTVGNGYGTMLVYSTFPLEIKTPSKSLEHLIFVDF